MSTRCHIGIENADGTITAIYCHNDGSRKAVGGVLATHYTDVEKVQRLIKLGDISSLGERVDPTGDHSWREPETGTTVSYHRDRGENLRPGIQTTWDKIIDGLSYAYVFSEGRWYWRKAGRSLQVAGDPSSWDSLL